MKKLFFVKVIFRFKKWWGGWSRWDCESFILEFNWPVINENLVNGIKVKSKDKIMKDEKYSKIIKDSIDIEIFIDDVKTLI